MKKINKNYVFGIVLILILVGVGVWFGMNLNSKDPASASKYAVVELTTGEVYFGELHFFPRWKLVNVWVLQRSQGENNQPQIGVTPITKAFWGPMNELFLNKKDVVSWSYLRNDSQFIKAMENPESVNQQQGAQGAGAPNVPQAATSTFKGPNSAPPGTP